jgi:SAM-dependent methyltransferase
VPTVTVAASPTRLCLHRSAVENDGKPNLRLLQVTASSSCRMFACGVGDIGPAIDIDRRVAAMTDASGAVDRFSGFADLYDAVRPRPPDAIGPLLHRYANEPSPRVVDLGSGTGLSSRWAARWASSVIGVEPNDDMRRVAEGKATGSVAYQSGFSFATGLPDASADIVIAVQAMHWMEPVSTLAEVARILRPGGAFASLDADWPPVAGLARAESAWSALDDLVQTNVHDAEDSVKAWPKGEHLANMIASHHFAWCRELFFHQTETGGADRFIALLQSQGGYQSLLKQGRTPAEIGVDIFEREVRAAYAESTVDHGITFSWRARMGVTS